MKKYANGIHNLDPWISQYVENIPGEHLSEIAWTDAEAIGRYPQHAWLYDKLELCNLLGYKAYDLNVEEPESFPMFGKLRTNVLGMGISARRLESMVDVHYHDMIAMPIMKGKHLTTDFVIWKGKVKDSYTFEGIYEGNSFKMFRSVSCGDKPTAHQQKVIRELFDFTGIINIEMIGGKIIEVHLRPGSQYFDISGGMYEQALKCFAELQTYYPVQFERTYSRVFRGKNDAFVKFNGKLDALPDGIRSVQLCFEDQKPLSANPNDEFTYVLFVVNGTNLKAIERFGKHLKSKLIIRSLPKNN